MDFCGHIFIQARTIERVATMIRAGTPPDEDGQAELISFLGTLAIKGCNSIQYDGTIDSPFREGPTFKAISDLGLHGSIIPNLSAGRKIEPASRAWRNARFAKRLEAVLAEPPPIPRGFPGFENEHSQRMVKDWTEVLGCEDRDFAQLAHELLAKTKIKGNKLLSGIAAQCAATDPDSAGLQMLKSNWFDSDQSDEGRYLIASGLVNAAFRPFLIPAMANDSGAISLVTPNALQIFSSLEDRVVQLALRTITRDGAGRVPVSSADFIADEPDLITIAGLRILGNADWRKGPEGLIREAMLASTKDRCLNALFYSIVRKANYTVHQHDADLLEELAELEVSLRRDGLMSGISMRRRWLDTVPSGLAKWVTGLGTAGVAALFAPDGWLLAGGAAGYAGYNMDKILETVFGSSNQYAGNMDLDGAASIRKRIQSDGTDQASIATKLAPFWNGATAFYMSKPTQETTRVFLLRHGRVNKKDGAYDSLSEDGLRTRDQLPALLSADGTKIERAFYEDGYQRCRATVELLPCDKLSYGPRAKSGLRTLNAVLSSLGSGNYAICFRAESIECGACYHIEEFALHTDIATPEFASESKQRLKEAYDYVYQIERSAKGIWRQINKISIPHKPDGD